MIFLSSTAPAAMLSLRSLRQVPSASPRYPISMLPCDYALQGWIGAHISFPIQHHWAIEAIYLLVDEATTSPPFLFTPPHS